MAAYISFQPTDYFNTKLWEGTGATLAVTGVGFQPDLVWQKNRTITSNHLITDSVRAYNSQLYSSSTSAEGTLTNVLTAFGADGFTAGTSSDFNGSGNDIVTWNWKAGTTSGLSGGTITPTGYSINTTSGFGIYEYGGNATAGATIAHGLGVAPKMLITKKVSSSDDWYSGHQYNSAYPWNSYINLNASNGTLGENASAWLFNSTAPDATNITLGSGTGINGSGITYVIYAFAPIQGYSQLGSYEGNASVDGTFVYTGFRPAFLMIKRYNGGTNDWMMFDNKREGRNVDNDALLANGTQAEITTDYVDLLSNGFKLRSTSDQVNGGSDDYIYMAFAEFPIVSSNSKPGTAR